MVVKNLIFNILEARYPDKDPIDRTGKALFDVFGDEQEKAIDEDASIGGLEDVGKFINDDDESDVLLDEDGVREVLATAWKQKRLEISKRETSSRVWKTVETDGDLCTEEIPRGSGRAEAENEVQSMWACGTLGERM